MPHSRRSSAARGPAELGGGAVIRAPAWLAEVCHYLSRGRCGRHRPLGLDSAWSSQSHLDEGSRQGLRTDRAQLL